MADVTILPAAQIQTVSPAGGQPPQNTPPANPQPGALVSGTIAGRDASGNYLLKSPQGTFTLQSNTPLTYNSDVTIRVGGNAAGNTNARIVSVNGEPFSLFSTPEPETSDSVSATLLAPAPDASTPSPSTATTQAIVVSAPGQSTNAALAAGNTVIIRVSAPQTPPPAQAQQQPEAGPPQSQTQGPSQPSIEASVSVAVQPQQVAQNPQVQALQPAPPQLQQATTPALANAPAPASAAPIETELAPGEAVTQTPQVQGPEPQPQQSQPQQPLPAPPPPPPASVSALYSVYAKQSAAPAAAASAPPPSAPAAQTIPLPAQIVNADESGMLTLQTALGNVTVQTSSPSAAALLSPGTSVTIEFPAATLAQAIASTPATLTELASSWQTLKDILGVVSGNSPEAANSLLTRLPQVGPDFTSTSTAFIATLLQNDARRLLGDDTVDSLRQSGRQDLVDKFSGELASLSEAFTAPAARQMPGWQMLFMPFVYQEAIQQARIFVKREAPKKERANSRNTHDTRFVVEVDLSELGPLQMDGLVRKGDTATAFDLVIRSHQPFTPADQAEMAAIYTGVAELTGFKGSLAFQVTRIFPVKPLEDAAGDEVHGITA